VAVFERQRIHSPSAAFLGDGALLTKPPGAAALTLEQKHRQARAADDGRRRNVGERRGERCQGGHRTSDYRRGCNLLVRAAFVIAITVIVIATHAGLLLWPLSLM